MANRLQGKVAVITGGCSGIGLGTVELFISEGACVVVADILAENGMALEKRFSGQLRFIRCDVTQENDIAAAIALAVSEFGGLDIIFNNAGSVGCADTVENMSQDKWDHTMNLLVRSAMFGIKHSIAPMKARGGGAIVNTASISGVSTGGPPAYCVAKAAVIQLSRLAALELAPHRIRVNSVLPGIIPTPIFGNIIGMTHEKSEQLAELLLEGASSLQPLHQPGTPRDIAEACLFLASEASAFITGTELRVDGGATLIPQMELNPEKPGSMGYLIAQAMPKMGDRPNEK